MRALFSSLVEAAGGRINWAHLILGELVKHRYISTVLTTNFDQLVLSGMVRAGIIPVVSDGIESLNRISGQPTHPQLIEIHGSRHTYQLRNQPAEVAEIEGQPSAVAAVSALLQNATTFIVVGYGGREQGLMDLLIKAATASHDKNLIWVSYAKDASTLSEKARAFLNTGRNSLLLLGRDADTFFFNLAREIGIGSPSSLTDPLGLVTEWLDTVAAQDNQSSDIATEIAAARRRLDAARQCMAATPNDPVARARQLRLSGDTRAAWNLLASSPDVRFGAAIAEAPDVTEERLSIAENLADRFADREASEFLISYWRAKADEARDADTRGHALNKLGKALATLGERESGTARLTEAVEAYRAALAEHTRERMPPDWALTQNNLGNALSALAERESGTERFAEAVEAYHAALEERTRERSPLKWATTQNNLGNTLLRLGERESGTARLTEAVKAYRAALEEYTRERTPLQWAGTQNNLGNALSALGERESGTARFTEAVAAYRAALQERTRDRVPFEWAQTMENIALAEQSWGDKTQDPAHWRAALNHVEAALEEYRKADAAFYIEKATHLRDALTARLTTAR